MTYSAEAFSHGRLFKRSDYPGAGFPALGVLFLRNILFHGRIHQSAIAPAAVVGTLALAG